MTETWERQTEAEYVCEELMMVVSGFPIGYDGGNVERSSCNE